MSRNTTREILTMSIVLQILALLPLVEASPGICPNYYGPFEPAPFSEPSCQNMMKPGSYNVQWAHGPQSEWSWQNGGQLDMQANMRYLLTYSSMGEVSIEESEDSSLTGYTVICCSNKGPDEIVLCLEPASQEPRATMNEMLMGYEITGYKVYLDGNYVGTDGKNGDALDGNFEVHDIPCWGNHWIVVDDGEHTHTLDYLFGCGETYSIYVGDPLFVLGNADGKLGYRSLYQ